MSQNKVHHSSLANILLAYISHPTPFLTSLKHYLKYTRVIMQHLDSPQITTTTGQMLHYPSIKTHSQNKILDCHLFNAVIPVSSISISTPQAKSSQIYPLTKSWIHQCLAHCYHHKIDKMCNSSILLGPRKPPPQWPTNVPSASCQNSATHQKERPLLQKIFHLDNSHTWTLDSGIFSHIMVFIACYWLMPKPIHMLWLFCTPIKIVT